MTTVTFFSGDYRARQLMANGAQVDVYVEYHFNHFSRSAAYSLAKVPPSPHALAIELGTTHSKLMEEYLGVEAYINAKDKESPPGILKMKKSSRDMFNCSLLNSPALILEPLFLSNPEHVALVVTEKGQDVLSAILTKTLRTVLPNEARDAHIGFSVGHKYQKESPLDRGYLAVDRPDITEADLSEVILLKAALMLRYDLDVEVGFG